MVARVVGNLDLRANGIPARDAGIARVKCGVIDASALRAVVEATAYLKLVPTSIIRIPTGLASEPVIPPAGLILLAVRVIPTRLP